MKVFRKVFAAAIALTAIAMATSAFAAADGTATYDASKPSMTIADTSAFENNTQQTTIAVVPTEFGNGEVSANDIYYINQGTGAEVATIADNIGLKAALITPTSYEVRVGGGDRVLTYEVPAVQFDATASGKVSNPEAGRAGVTGTFTVNAGITTDLLINLKNEVSGELGQYTWEDIDIANVNGLTFTFGLEIVKDKDVDISNIVITGVEVQ